MWKLIELDEALKIMNSHEERLMWLDNWVIMMLRNDINSLPQIDIEETITEEIKSYEWLIPKDWALAKKDALQELLQKFKS